MLLFINVLNGDVPSYLLESLTLYVPSRNLRSGNEITFYVPMKKKPNSGIELSPFMAHNYGIHSHLCNIRNSETLSKIQYKLKHYYLNQY